MNRIQKLFSSTHYQILEERRLAQILSSNFKGKRILDIGCGQGKYLRLLKNISSEVTGVDVNSVQVENLRKEGFNAYTPDNLPAQKYDLLLMSHIVEHMAPEDLIAFMDKYLEMLEENGALLLLTPMPGIRFWHDYTHIRPYTPQSIGMMFGILNGPVSFKPKNKLMLNEIWFFRDSWRIRNHRSYYPSPQGNRDTFNRYLILTINIVLAGLHAISRGRLGILASWAGIYRKLPLS